MPRRFRRRDENSLLRTLIGLAVAAGLSKVFGRAVRPDAPATRRSPLALVLVLLGVLMAFGLLITVLNGIISALGGAGGAALLCLAPAAVLLFVGWAILQGQRPGQQKDAGAQPTQAEAAPAPGQAATAAPKMAGTPRQTAPRTIAAYPEKGASAPADYRKRAASYRGRIQKLLKARRRGPLAQGLAEVLPRLSSWEERVGQLADRVALFENDDLIRRDIKEVPNHIARLSRQIPLEADPVMQEQMERTLSAYQQQQQHLEALARLIRRTRLNLDDTLAAMGTIYSQVQVLNAMDIDGATAARITDEIDVEVNRLNDLLSALSEVNHGSAEGAPAPETDGIPDEEAGLARRKARLQNGGTTGGGC